MRALRCGTVLLARFPASSRGIVATGRTIHSAAAALQPSAPGSGDGEASGSGLRVAYPGVAGAFSESALHQYFAERQQHGGQQGGAGAAGARRLVEPVGMGSYDDIFQSVSRGEVTAGVRRRCRPLSGRGSSEGVARGRGVSSWQVALFITRAWRWVSWCGRWCLWRTLSPAHSTRSMTRCSSTRTCEQRGTIRTDRPCRLG
jgi:hypothetical protein